MIRVCGWKSWSGNIERRAVEAIGYKERADVVAPINLSNSPDIRLEMQTASWTEQCFVPAQNDLAKEHPG